MAYVRKRGDQVAIVHGSRNPQTKGVEQEILFTIYSKGEALEIIGRGQPGSPVQFRSWLQERNPQIRFDWSKICRGIEVHLNGLPDSYDYVTTRRRGQFRPDLNRFVRQLILTDPGLLTSSWELIREHRRELEFVRDLIDWRLSIPEPTPEQLPWMEDNPFHWRLALASREVPPEAEEFAAGYYRNRDLDRAEAVFSMLTEIFEGYAEGYNYLGLIALEREEYESAIAFFERTIEEGRKLFPKRVAKERWWCDHATRPYMRGLRNLTLANNQAGRHEDALVLCERLRTECGDDVSAAAHEAAACLSLGQYRRAIDAALRMHHIDPAETLIAALAAFEVENPQAVRAWFLHAVMNAPRTVAMILGEHTPPPGSNEEARDHEGGIALRRSIRAFIERQSGSSRQFFRDLWRASATLRRELVDVQHRWQEDRQGQDRSAFVRMMEMRSLQFAQRAASAVDAPAAVRNGRLPRESRA